MNPSPFDPYGEKRVVHDIVVSRGEDVYPPELLAEAKRNEERYIALYARLMELQSLTTIELFTVIQNDRTERVLSVEEIRFIHDIAIQRMRDAGSSDFPEAFELSRAAMQTASNRVA